MAYLSFNSEMINSCQPTVVMILNWFKREYQAVIKVHHVVPLGNCTYHIEAKDLPDKQIRVCCRELVPGVVIIKTL